VGSFGIPAIRRSPFARREIGVMARQWHFLAKKIRASLFGPAHPSPMKRGWQPLLEGEGRVLRLDGVRVSLDASV